MSATEWKFVPVEPTREMLVAALKTNGACPIYAAMLDAAPVPPSVESLLENWTPADQQAFAKFRDEHFPGEISSYAIQSLGSAWKDGQANASPEEPQYTGTGSDSLDCILGVGGFASFGPLDAQPASHLTIPGALEWDGDNGTHSADGEHSESSAAIATLKALGYTHNGGQFWKPPVGQKPDFDLIDDLRAQLDESNVVRQLIQAWVDVHGRPIPWAKAIEITAVTTKMPEDEKAALLALDDEPSSQYTAVDMTTAAAGGFRNGQAELHAVLNQAYMALIGYLPGHRNDLTDAAIAACGAILFPVEAKAACSRCGDWGHIETEDSAHDCPECGPSVIERAVEAGVMNAPVEQDPFLAVAGQSYVPLTDEEINAFESMGSGNKAKRRIAALAAKAKPESFPCWSCSAPVTMANRADADGNCPHCEAELDLEDWPKAQAAKPKTCIEYDQPYCHGVCVERGDQDYDRDQAAKGGEQ